MITRAETPQLDLLPILNLLRITVAPLHRHIRVCIRIHQDVECAVAIELWEEGYGCCDLTENGLNLFLDFFLGLFRLCFCASG
jgi:hypothetical protein